MLKPENYTIEEAEFLFRCELDQLEKNALISTQRHRELLSSHETLSQKRKERRVNATPSSVSPPLAIPLKTSEEKRLQTMNLFLILGTVFLALAGLIFSTASWMVFGALGRCLILVINIIFLFAVSLFTEKKLGLKKTAATFWNLGLCLTPLIILSLSAFGALGDYFSFEGEGRFLLGMVTSLLMIGLMQISFKKFNQSLFLMIRHGFEVLAQGFAWFWLGSSLGLSTTQQVYLSFIGWGIFLILESLCLHETLSSVSLSESFESIASPYMIRWLPHKQVIFQWTTLLMSFLFWCDYGYCGGNHLGWVIGFTICLAGLFALSPSHKRALLSYCYPVAIQLLILGNLVAITIDVTWTFKALNTFFLVSYLGLTYFVPSTSIQSALRQCLRTHVAFYVGSYLLVNVFELNVDFYLAWFVLGLLSGEGLLRHRHHLAKGFVYYGLSNVLAFLFVVSLGANLFIQTEHVLIMATGVTLLFQIIWLAIHPAYRSIGSEGGFVLTLTLFTVGWILSVSGFLSTVVVLMVIGGVGVLLLLILSLHQSMKPWIVIWLMLLNLVAGTYDQITLIYICELIAMLLMSVFKGMAVRSMTSQKMISFITWSLRLNTLLLMSLILGMGDAFKGLISLELFSLTLSMGAETLQMKQLKERKDLGVLTLYLFSFTLSSFCGEMLDVYSEEIILFGLFFPLLATVINNRMIYQLNHPTFKTVEWIHVIIFNIYLGLYAIESFDFLTLALSLTFYVMELVLSYWQSELHYRKLAQWSLAIFIFLRFFEFFASISWMIYLIVFGVGFVLIAMKQEAKARKGQSKEKPDHSSN